LVRRVPEREVIRPSVVADTPPSDATERSTSTPVPPEAAARAVVQPLAPERFKIQFTISGETRERLRMTQNLLGRSVSHVDLAAVFDRALVALLADLEKKKLALVTRPRTRSKPTAEGSRVIPAAVRRGVWRRDRGRCAYIGTGGRCRERGALEFHHVVPFAAGGSATIENIQLRCRAHNGHEADMYFGPQRGP
jgi:hypothetical protein